MPSKQIHEFNRAGRARNKDLEFLQLGPTGALPLLAQMQDSLTATSAMVRRRRPRKLKQLKKGKVKS